jgi:hypothetical protein
MTHPDRLCAWKCARCKRLTLGWCSQTPPTQCSWPTCRADALDPYKLRRDPYTAPEES